MARKEDFENRFFDLLESNFKSLEKNQSRMEKKLEENTRETKEGFEKIEGRVRNLEAKALEEKPESIKDLQPFFSDPVIRKAIYYIAGAVLLALAAWSGIDIAKVVL